MKNKKMKNPLFMAALLGGVLVTGCQLEPYELPAEEVYTREFIKKYGVFDKEQDWNMATRQSVTVNPGNATEVKIYADVKGERYLFAHYENVHGSQKLEFDLPENVTTVIVKANGEERVAKVGETVDFTRPASRTITTYDKHEGWLTITLGDWREIEPSHILDYREKLPEKEYNVDKYTQNFYFENNGDFVIYPVYYNTYRYNKLGIFTVDSDGTKHHYQISCAKEGNEIQYATELADGKHDEAWLCCNGWSISEWGINNDYQNYTETDYENLRTIILQHADEVKAWTHLTGDIKEATTIELPGQWVDDGLPIYDQYGSCDFSTWSTYNSPRIKVRIGDVKDVYKWTNVAAGQESVNQSMLDNNQYLMFRSRGIAVHMDDVDGKPVNFGMYLTTDEGYTFYSYADYNPDKLDYSDPNSPQACHAVTYMNTDSKGNEYRVLAFEDWANAQYSKSDMDLNDMVFYITSVKPSEIPDVHDKDKEDEEDKAYSWILAAEDLGNLDDFDFNDIVVEVKHVAGQETAEVTALAAGGTLPLYLYYNNAMVAGEFHSWFGDGSYPSNVMINTGSGPSAKGKTVTISVPKDFSMAHDSSKVENGNMGGFYIKVERTDGTYETIAAPEGSDAVVVAPQMLCLPCGWKWPKERTGIHDAYPKFNDWCKDHTCNNWHEECKSSCLYNQ